MKYILKNRFQLRGYRKLPFALFDTLTSRTYFLTKREYSLLLDCDGQTELNPSQMDEETKKIFRTFTNKNILEISDNQKLLPEQEYYDYDVEYKDGIQFSITGRCNYKCKHCFMSAPHAKYDEMSFSDIVKVFEKLEQCGIRNIQLTGGELLSHPSFKQIVEEATKHSLNIELIYTNGLLLNQDIIDHLRKNRQYPKMQISFDGLGYHDWMRGVPNAEQYAIRAIKLCKKNHIECEVAMVLFRDNANSLDSTITFLESLGVSNIRVSNVMNLGEWLPYSKQHGLTIEEVYEIYLDFIPQYLSKPHTARLSLGGFFSYNPETNEISSTYENTCSKEKEDKYYLCKSIKRSFYITSTGLLLPCASTMSTPVEEQSLSILDHDLKQLLNSSYLYKIGNSKAKDLLLNNEKCANCPYKYLCLGGCRANGLILTKDLYGIDENTCIYFTKGYKERKDKLLEKIHKI